MRLCWPHGKTLIFTDLVTHPAGATACDNQFRPYVKTSFVVVLVSLTCRFSQKNKTENNMGLHVSGLSPLSPTYPLSSSSPLSLSLP